MSSTRKFFLSFLGLRPGNVAQHATENAGNMLQLYSMLALLAALSIGFSFSVFAYKVSGGQFLIALPVGAFAFFWGRAIEQGVMHSAGGKSVIIRGTILLLTAGLLTVAVSLLTMEDQIIRKHEQGAQTGNAGITRPIEQLRQQKAELAARLSFRQKALLEEADNFQKLAEAEAKGAPGEVYGGHVSSSAIGCGGKCRGYLRKAELLQKEARDLAIAQNDSLAALDRQIGLKEHEIKPQLEETRHRLSLGEELAAFFSIIADSPAELLGVLIKFLASIIIESSLLIVRSTSPRNSYLKLLEDDETANATYNEALMALMNQHCKAETQGNEQKAGEYHRRIKAVRAAVKEHLDESKSVAPDEETPAADAPAIPAFHPDFTNPQTPF